MATYEQALAAWSRGDLAAADAACRALLHVSPAHADALNLLAGVAFRRGDAALAIATLERLLKLRPADALARMNLGNLKLAAGDHEAALDAYRHALELNPQLAEAHYNQGNALKLTGRLEAAQASYRAALALVPGYAPARVNLGNLLRDTGRPAEAIVEYEAALAASPGLGEALENLAHAQFVLGRLKQCVASYQRLLAGHAGSASAYQRLGDALRRLGHDAPACAALERALELDPGNPETYSSLGLLYHATNRVDDAQSLYERALERGFAPAYFRAERYRCAIQRWDRLRMEADASYLASAVHVGEPYVDPLLMIVATGNPQDQLVAARNRSAYLERAIRLTGSLPGASQPRHPPGEGRLRIGYLSPDLRDHVVGSSMVELLERHDRRRVEVIGMSYGGDDQSPVRRRLVAACDAFHEWAPLEDTDIAARIAALELDVLVDLAGHSQHRQAMLVHRPAALQVAYLGYPGTSGAPWIDYLIADGYVVPPTHEEHYTEAIVRLPESFFPSDTTSAVAEGRWTRADEGLPESAFVYACFNNHARIAPEVFDGWMRILAAVEGSVLWLQSWHPAAKASLIGAATVAGIDAGRLHFANRVEPRSRHLERHELADLYLDTYPYNMHTTSRDVLWAGAPLLTRSGDTLASRVAGSLLRTLGLYELVTHSAQEYERLAIMLARDPQRLAALRERVRAGRATSALFDMARLAGHLEDAFEAITARLRAGERPVSLDVPPRAR